jgi:hypothetical protein
MKPRLSKSGFPRRYARRLAAVLCVLLLSPGPMIPGGSTPRQQQPAGDAAQDAPPIPAAQLDSLVAPIALYPDSLLSQVLVASTYPLEIIQLHQWLTRNKDLKDKALADAVSKQSWDTSIQAMAPLPDLVKRLADDIQWTTDLGNAFLAQQSDVMDSIQRMRQKAQGTGALKSNEQVKVETQTVETKQVIVVQQSSPEVVYVPSYNPTVVYGAPVYPYPPIYYPPYPAGGVIAASAISFGVGVAMGAAWGGGWGGCGWGNNDININTNNNFNRNTNVSGGNRVSGGNTWQHNPQHRGGTPYSNRSTANKFGGTARGDSLSNRGGAGNRGGVGDNRGGAGNRGGVGDNRGGAGNRGGVGDNRGGVGDNRGGAGNRGGVGDNRGGAGNRGGVGDNRGGAGGGDKVGNRSVSSGGGNSRGSTFGGSSGGFNGSSSRASSSRGSSSMSSSRGGGGGGGASRGGGGGGGGRGGGGGGGGRR